MQLSLKKHMCHPGTRYVPTEYAIYAKRVRLGKTQGNLVKNLSNYVPTEYAFMCHPGAPKNGERTTPRHKKEFSTCSPYLKIKDIKKENQ